MNKNHGEPRGLPTSKDVAKLAGVSQSTVSYVMSGKRAIAADTRRRVEQAMHELGYQPNAGARALRGSKTNVIALVVHLGADADLSETLPYIEAVVEQARRRDYEVVLSTADEGPEGIRRLAGRRVCDAFVLMDIRRDDERVPVAAALGLPVVLVGFPAEAYGLDAVDFDTAHASELLVDELADTGHRHVVVVGETAEEIAELPFIAKFQEAARRRAVDRGIGFTVVDRAKEGWAGIREAGPRILAERSEGLGVIARTAQVTEWMLQLLDVEGLRVGRDVSLVSMCTDARATGWETHVTNVSAEPAELIERGMRILFDRIGGDAHPGRRELVELRRITRRETTARIS
ncbi:LacI family DNA-binding transcriptional regulator [Agromyces mangrovi Wang et al. 2018]|uniref:LacI family DNA-binding transcriptional regulator n=1 Tax=Agromyces mangrovi TaxID=1858653 RepID=UPI0025741B94|nr:LacI family DNA-binding transcriptional regulator [Agromyces mangrovi]BDZ64431.1 LacI family transcriptional regulator [Agromyces mangrovi]